MTHLLLELGLRLWCKRSAPTVDVGGRRGSAAAELSFWGGVTGELDQILVGGGFCKEGITEGMLVEAVDVECLAVSGRGGMDGGHGCLPKRQGERRDEQEFQHELAKIATNGSRQTRTRCCQSMRSTSGGIERSPHGDETLRRGYSAKAGSKEGRSDWQTGKLELGDLRAKGIRKIQLVPRSRGPAEEKSVRQVIEGMRGLKREAWVEDVGACTGQQQPGTSS